MTRKLSISLTDDEYDKLMAKPGNNRSEKIRNLILDSEDNFFTEHFELDSIHKLDFQEQSFVAMGVLMSLLWPEKLPEKIVNVTIPKFDKGEITPLFRAIMAKALERGDKYDDLLEFIGEGQLLYLADPLDHERIAYLRVLGQSLSRYYKNEQS